VTEATTRTVPTAPLVTEEPGNAITMFAGDNMGRRYADIAAWVTEIDQTMVADHRVANWQSTTNSVLVLTVVGPDPRVAFLTAQETLSARWGYRLGLLHPGGIAA
jgi:hypothetical protein